MKAVRIVNRLKEVLPNYTDDFSTILNVSSLSRVSTTITCITATAHGLSNNDYITIRGAKEPIALSTITFSNGIATATALIDHKLSDPSLFSPDNLPLYVEISGTVGYNGTWELVSVPSKLVFTFKVSGSPANYSGGFLLLQDQDGYNGYKQITVVNSTTFTYTTTKTIQSPAQGTIQVSGLTRIDYASTSQRLQDFYSQNSNGILQTWLYVVMGQNQAYKDDTIVGDTSSSKRSNESYWNLTQQDFSLYIIIPAKSSILAGDISDTARGYLKPLLKSLANYVFLSDLNDEYCQPCQYIGNETDDYIEAKYTHRFDFTIQSLIQTSDTADYIFDTPLQSIDGLFIDKNISYKPVLR